MAEPQPSGLALWYDRPAGPWIEALPIGNGRLGCMVFGGVDTERLQLNEDSVSSGSPEDSDNPAALAALPEIRRLLFEGKFPQANALALQKLICRGGGSGFASAANLPFGCYQTLNTIMMTDPIAICRIVVFFSSRSRVMQAKDSPRVRTSR